LLCSPSSVAVVGAGLSGLTAAYNLQKLGYNVTVFEADSRVGGKIQSVYLPEGVPTSDYLTMTEEMEAKAQALCGDKRPTELGGIITWGDNMKALIEELDVPYGFNLLDLKVTVSLGPNQTAQLTQAEFFGLVAQMESPDQDAQAVIGAAVEAFFQTAEIFPEMLAPRHDGSDPELAMSTADFAEKYGFSVLVKGFRPSVVSYGYGYFENTPASVNMPFLYRYVSFLAGLIPGDDLYMFPCGFQSVTEAMAKYVDVRLDAKVSSVQRNEDSIVVQANGQPIMSFDHLILSPTLNMVPDFLDASEEERELFEKIKYIRYITTVANLTSTEDLVIDLYADQGFEENINSVNLVINPNSNLTAANLAYQIVDKNITEEEAYEVLNADMESYWMGSAGEGIIARRVTDNYFPTVSTEDFDFYDSMEALQGVKNTYYVGSYLSYELTTMVETYARELVLRKFDPVL
jgi:hypothetical protein